MVVAVDADYSGLSGFIGAGVSAAYVNNTQTIGNNADYIRRVTYNVALVDQVTAQSLILAQPLIAGVPVPGMKVQPVVAFTDREGGSFIQEWSALFILKGEQGDTIFFYYPRLQTNQGACEIAETVMKPLERYLLNASFRALPIVDPLDGQEIFSFRTYLPAPNTKV